MGNANNYRVNSDRGVKFILENIFVNNRLKYYDMYIKLAKENGYTVTSYVDYLNSYINNKDKKVLILRHDIDSITPNPRKVFNIERKNGVKSTYYFRWNTMDAHLINELNENGFEVGLHYETLATYCEKNNITKVDDSIIKICRENLKEEIAEFKRVTGVNIKTIANHGHPINVKLGMSNNMLIEDEDYLEYGILGEVYDKEFYKTVTTHIMDTNIMYNYGYAYKDNPIESILNGDRVIVFLSHPEHWRYSVKGRCKLLIKLLLKKYTTSTNREFKRIM